MDDGYQPSPEGVENVQSDNVQCTKILRNGQLFIERDGKTYTAEGQVIVPSGR